MKTNKLLFSIFIILLISLSFNSCSKDNIEEPIENIISIEQSSRLQNNGGLSNGSDLGSNSGNNQMNIFIYQFYRNGDHLYTKNYEEGINADYDYERTLGLVRTTGPVNKAITRWYNIYNGDRVITTDVSQHPAIVNSINNFYYSDTGNYGPLLPGNIPGTNVNSDVANSNGHWQYEKILGYTGAYNNSYPVHTYYNDNLKDHIYLTDFSILGNGGNGYVYEGISFYL